MPAKPPPDDPGQQPDRCCRDVGATMIGHFVTRLEVEAGKAGGSLTAVQIRAVAQHFIAAEQPRFRAYYRRAFDQCSREREARAVEKARHMAFERILMRRFAHLFPSRPGDEGGTGVLSRRIIPGFTLAVGKMIGPQMHHECETAAQALLDRHGLDDGGWDWQAVHADPGASAMADRVLVAMAAHFAAFDKRRAWFMAMVNDHLAPPAPGAADEHFRLGESGFSALMRALYAPLAPTAAAPGMADVGRLLARL